MSTYQSPPDAVESKLVDVTPWVDLTAAITTACAGAPASDPRGIAGGTTVTTSTGSFNGSTVPCNAVTQTTSASISDGHTETLNYNLPTLQSLFPTYDPSLYGIQLVMDLVTTGTLTGTQPIIFLAVRAAGALPTVAEGAGWAVASATSALFEYAIGQTTISGMNAIDPTSILARGHTRFQLHMQTTIRRRDSWVPAGTTEFQAQSSARIIVPMVTATDALALCFGQLTTTAAQYTGFKFRVQVRLFAIRNLFMSDLDLGCQSST